jgi:hypothetical protein
MSKYVDLKDKYESSSDSPKFLKPNLNESLDKPSSSKVKEKSSEAKNEGLTQKVFSFLDDKNIN